MEVIYTKVIALFLLVVLTLVFGLIPIRIYRFLSEEYGEGQTTEGGPEGREKNRNKRRLAEVVITGILHLGGGVLISTCFLHMLPEVREQFVEAAAHGDAFLSHSKFPFPELVVCLGFFTIYGIEQIVYACRKPSAVQPDVKHRTRNHNSPLNRSFQFEKNSKQVAETAFYPDLNSTEIETVPSADTNRNHECKIKNAAESIRPQIPKYGSMESIGRNITEGDGNRAIATLRGSLIILALSIHAIFEGMAIGLQPTESDVWTLFAAVTIHKCVIAFCVGLELISMKTRILTVVLNMLALAVVSPLGVGIGIIIMIYSSGGATPAHSIIVGVFQGLATGTLLYVTFFEILGKDRRHKGMRLTKFVCMVLGFLVMAGILAWE